MSISFVALGTKTQGNGVTAVGGALPAGYAVGDLLVCLSMFRTITNGAIASDWAGAYAPADLANIYELISYKIATSTSEAAPTITPSNGTSSQVHTSRIVAFRGVDPVTPFGASGAVAQNLNIEDIGPIAAPTAVNAEGAVIVYGGRLEATWTAVATLTGDGLTWNELFEDTSTTTNSIQTVADYALWTGGPPSLTSKTFDVTTGAQVGAGRMFLLNPLVVGHPAGKRLGGVPFARQVPGVW